MPQCDRVVSRADKTKLSREKSHSSSVTDEDQGN